MNISDSMIVDMFLDRNEDAIKEVSEKYGKRIREISYGITGNVQTSEECENDTYIESLNMIQPN